MVRTRGSEAAATPSPLRRLKRTGRDRAAEAHAHAHARSPAGGARGGGSAPTLRDALLRRQDEVLGARRRGGATADDAIELLDDDDDDDGTTSEDELLDDFDLGARDLFAPARRRAPAPRRQEARARTRRVVLDDSEASEDDDLADFIASDGEELEGEEVAADDLEDMEAIIASQREREALDRSDDEGARAERAERRVRGMPAWERRLSEDERDWVTDFKAMMTFLLIELAGGRDSVQEINADGAQRAHFAEACRRCEDRLQVRAASSLASGGWQPRFSDALHACPAIGVCDLEDFEECGCEACGRSNHVARGRITLRRRAPAPGLAPSMRPYRCVDDHGRLVYKPREVDENKDDDEDDDEDPGHEYDFEAGEGGRALLNARFDIGRFCRARSVLFHAALHFTRNCRRAAARRLLREVRLAKDTRARQAGEEEPEVNVSAIINRIIEETSLVQDCWQMAKRIIWLADRYLEEGSRRSYTPGQATGMEAEEYDLLQFQGKLGESDDDLGLGCDEGGEQESEEEDAPRQRPSRTRRRRGAQRNSDASEDDDLDDFIVDDENNEAELLEDDSADEDVRHSTLFSSSSDDDEARLLGGRVANVVSKRRRTDRDAGAGARATRTARTASAAAAGPSRRRNLAEDADAYDGSHGRRTHGLARTASLAHSPRDPSKVTDERSAAVAKLSKLGAERRLRQARLRESLEGADDAAGATGDVAGSARREQEDALAERPEGDGLNDLERRALLVLRMRAEATARGEGKSPATAREVARDASMRSYNAKQIAEGLKFLVKSGHIDRSDVEESCWPEDRAARSRAHALGGGAEDAVDIISDGDRDDLAGIDNERGLEDAGHELDDDDAGAGGERARGAGGAGRGMAHSRPRFNAVVYDSD